MATVTDARLPATEDTPSATHARLRALGSSPEDALFLAYGIVPGPCESPALALDASVRAILDRTGP